MVRSASKTAQILGKGKKRMVKNFHLGKNDARRKTSLRQA